MQKNYSTIVVFRWYAKIFNFLIDYYNKTICERFRRQITYVVSPSTSFVAIIKY